MKTFVGKKSERKFSELRNDLENGKKGGRRRRKGLRDKVQGGRGK